MPIMTLIICEGRQKVVITEEDEDRYAVRYIYGGVGGEGRWYRQVHGRRGQEEERRRRRK